MNILITKERRFQMDSDGTIYTDNESASGYNFFKRYLSVFDSVTVIGRLQKGLTTGNAIVTGPGVHFIPIPHYLGPTQYICKSLEIEDIFESIVQSNAKNSAFIARSPGTLGSVLIRKLGKIGHPFGMEIVGDPYDVFAPGAIKHPLRMFLRQWFTWSLRQECSKACAVSYVTEFSLQNRYPTAPGVFNTHYSSIQLEPSDFVATPKAICPGKRPFELVSVGTLAQMYKAPDVLIKAIGGCVRNGLDVKLTMVGDGRFRPDLERLSADLGLQNHVSFLGQLKSGDPVRRQLDKADLFILPSKGEGLPRAMIEAMARGLPCIGTSASGIPELLPAEDLVEPGNVEALTAKICEVASSAERLTAMAARNLEKSKDYLNDILQERRIKFYREVRQQTERFHNAAACRGCIPTKEQPANSAKKQSFPA